MTNPIDILLRTLAGSPSPTNADAALARNALAQAIANESSNQTRRRKWAVPALAVSLSLVVVIVAIQVVKPSPARATLLEIAQAAELADPLTIPPQSYAYTKSEVVVLGTVPADAFAGRTSPMAYLLPQTREIWVGSENTVQIRTTTNSPVFFAPQDKVDYYEAQLDKVDQVGQTTSQTVTGGTSILDERDWPTEPDALKTAIEDTFQPGSVMPADVDVAHVALSLISESSASPDLRAAALRALAGLNDLHLVQGTDGTSTFSITYSTPHEGSLTFVLDGAGKVVSRRTVNIDGDPGLGIPPNTVIEGMDYEPTMIVAEPDNR